MNSIKMNSKPLACGYWHARNLLAFALLVVFSMSAFGQHAVRDDFPNAKGQGVTFEHFTKEVWDASNFAALDAPGIMANGQKRTEVWKAEKHKTRWEIPVAEYVSGARVPGKTARFIRLQTHPAKPDYLLLKQVEVWAT